MRSGSGTTGRGVIASVGASLLFGVIFLVSGRVQASAEYVFAWRVLAILGCYLPALLLSSGRRALGEYFTLLTARRTHLWLLLPLSLMVGVQLWLFVWAPAHGKALDASLGFLLLPITLVLGGRLVFKSPVSVVQWLSVAVAALALALKIAVAPAFSWVTWFIALVYPVYFMLRHHTGLDHRAGFAVEAAVLTPPALVLLAVLPGPSHQPGQQAGVAVIAVCGAVAMVAYLAASRLLPLPLFGLLSYLEPLILVAVALLLGERLAPTDLAVYGLLALALLILGFEALHALRR